MSRKMSLALLASVSCLGFSDSAFAIDASPVPEPTVIYAREPAQPAPVRTASAERSQMGGGFLQFLFGDGPQQGGAAGAGGLRRLRPVARGLQRAAHRSPDRFS